MPDLKKSRTLPHHADGVATSPAADTPVWPWLLIATLVCLMMILLKLGAETPDEAGGPEMGSMPRPLPAGALSETAPVTAPTMNTPSTVAPAAAPQVALSATLVPMRELPNEQLMQPGDDSAYLKDGPEEEEAEGEAKD